MSASSNSSAAIVLLSGGLDSATCLAHAVNEGYDCTALSFEYGQRANAELTAAKRLAHSYGAAHRIARVELDSLGGSALTDDSIDVPESASDGIPDTYVPARNTIFLSIALGWAEIRNAEAIFIGVNSVDYSGYPDCRPAFIEAFQTMAALATRAGVEDGQAVTIRAPIQHETKADIIRRGMSLGVDYAETVSCYQADANGRACGRCEACQLRRSGFEHAGISDPTIYVDSYGR